MEAIQWPGSASVTAGPGAGKTEFLAQRAVYLLENGICPSPRRVLAISFKKDAARNLERRVRSRCSEHHSRRFRSVTFDAFTKSIVDRFANCLPEEWRPDPNYTIEFPRDSVYETYVSKLQIPYTLTEGREDLQAKYFEARCIGLNRLLTETTAEPSASTYASARWWADAYFGCGNSRLTFAMINRLAEAAQRRSKHLQKALRLTYPFVFVDEFQDTSYAQLDFLESLFGCESVHVTAVGDDKQRIMSFAGARTDAFSRFESHFQAQNFKLVRNYRSSPTMVAVQQVLADSLERNGAAVESMVEQAIKDDHAQIWRFRTRGAEAEKIAEWLVEDMGVRALQPDDYAILVKQKADAFERDLTAELKARKIALRNESLAIERVQLQDLRVSTLYRLFLPVLKLMTSATRQPQTWSSAMSTLLVIREALGDEARQRATSEELSRFVDDWRARISTMPLTSESADLLTDEIITFFGELSIIRSHGEYQVQGAMSRHKSALRRHLAACCDSSKDWIAAVDKFEGKNAVSLLTIHKSKGLEYDTVLLVGLDDRTWWSHSANNPEGASTLFVALSRAKQRAIFTYCASRGGDRGVSDLYDSLRQAGVESVDFE